MFGYKSIGTILIFLLKCVGFLILGYIILMIILVILVKTKNKKRVENVLCIPKKLPLFLDFIRWVLVDTLRGKEYPIWGIYMFVAKPGNGKTISMTEHIYRVRKAHPNINVFTNFSLKGQTGTIKTWKDIVDAPDNSIIAIDEIHMLFGSNGQTDFPLEMLGEITQNRHSRKQFITSTQDYDLVNVNFKRVCNFIVLCKNFWGLDRLFINYYFDRGAYESKSFLPNKKLVEFLRMFVASDETYARYDTLEKIKGMLDDIENKDVNGVVQKLKELKGNNELLSKEQKYLSVIIDRINNNLADFTLNAEKDKKIEDLKNQLNILKGVC